MFGTLCVISADNPASCSLGGFKETTAARRPCRPRGADRSEMNAKFRPSDFVLRTEASHSIQLQLLDDSYVNGADTESIPRIWYQLQTCAE